MIHKFSTHWATLKGGRWVKIPPPTMILGDQKKYSKLGLKGYNKKKKFTLKNLFKGLRG